MDIKLPNSSGSKDAEITKVLVSEGEEVNQDQALVETSAGKITSPKRAKVGRIHVAPGARVKTDATILSLEEPDDSAPESRINVGLEEGPVSVHPNEPVMDELEPRESA